MDFSCEEKTLEIFRDFAMFLHFSSIYSKNLEFSLNFFIFLRLFFFVFLHFLHFSSFSSFSIIFHMLLSSFLNIFFIFLQNS